MARSQPQAICNVCRAKGTSYHCGQGCDYDVCGQCYSGGHTVHQLQGRPGPPGRSGLYSVTPSCVR